MKKIDKVEAEQILIKLNDVFGFRHRKLWFPLIDTPYEDKIALNLKLFLKSKLKDNVLAYCQTTSKEFIEINEYKIQGSYFWRIESSELEFGNFSEKLILFPDYSGLIYFSHENSITFAGAAIVNHVVQFQEELNEIVWGSG